MAKQPYIPFYIGDYIRDTRTLPLNVRGGWVEIILQSWDNDGELTLTIEEFSRLMSCSIEEANLVIQTLKQKNIFGCTLLDDKRINIVVRKIKKMRELSKTRQKVGSLGGNPKLTKNLHNQKVNQDDNQNPEYEYNISNNTSNKYKVDININYSFEAFWNLYDKKVGSKEKCDKKWNKLKKEEREAIMNTLELFKRQFSNKQYQPYPETYLNNKRWNDELKVDGATLLAQNSKKLRNPWDYNNYSEYADACKEHNKTPPTNEEYLKIINQ